MTAISSTPAPTPGATLPSGLILPAGAAAPGGFTQAPGSGLFVPTNSGVAALTPRPLVVVSKDTPVNADAMLAQAREGYAQIAAREGAPAADVLLRNQFAIIDEVAAQERHDKVIADFFAGRVETGG